METNLILTVALAAAMIVVVLALVAVIVYQRWQIGDKNATLGRFIDENEKMRRRIQRVFPYT
jgi:cytochrome c-type biogenesis protein CcmH/NrfG